MKIRIKITECKWGRTVSGSEIKKYIIDCLKKNNVGICSSNVSGSTVDLLPSPEGKLFISLTNNHIPLKEGDKRIKDVRNYLLSKMLTKKQMDRVITILDRGLKDIGVVATIHLFEYDDDQSFIDLSNDVAKLANIQRSFPKGGPNA